MAAAEIFPEDLVTEILSYLPVKCLMRFRCVSKTWFRILTKDVEFTELHLNRGIINRNPNPSIIARIFDPMYMENREVMKIKFYYAEDYKACDKAIELDLSLTEVPPLFRPEFCGTCNGLICLISYTTFHDCLYVWNPLTKDHVKIPLSPVPSVFMNSVTYVYGLGYHEKTKEYKVIRIIYAQDSLISHVTVYTLGTESCRILEDNLLQVKIKSSLGKLFNGMLHWFGSKETSDDKHFEQVIVSFDIKDECFQEISLPNALRWDHLNHFSVRIVELGGFLCLYRNGNYGLRINSVEIWMMQEYGVVDSWLKKFRIELTEIHGPMPFRNLKPLFIANTGEIIISKSLFGLVAYNSSTKSATDQRGFRLFDPQVFTYIESLVSPSYINGVKAHH